jgi:hypothetical protein
MKAILRRAPSLPDLGRPAPPTEEPSLWEAGAVILLGLVLTGVGMAAALVAFAEKIDGPKVADPWGPEVVQTRQVSSR